VSAIRKTIIIMFSLVLIAGMYFGSPYREVKTLKEVETVELSKSDIVDYVNVTGRVIELGRHELYPALPSKVAEIYVRQGESVKRGDIIMELEAESDNVAAAAFYSEAVSFLENGHFSALRAFSGENAKAEEGERYYLISPIDGIVMDIYCNSGEVLSGMLPCAAVSDMNHLGIRAQIGEMNAVKVKPGMECEIKVDTFSEDSFKGKIITVEPYASAASIFSEDGENKTEVVAEMAGASGSIRPGYSASIKVKIGTYRGRIVVPYNCIGQDDNGEYVFRIGPDRKLERIPVSSVRELENGVEVSSQMAEGDLVIRHPEDYAAGETVAVR